MIPLDDIVALTTNAPLARRRWKATGPLKFAGSTGNSEINPPVDCRSIPFTASRAPDISSPPPASYAIKFGCNVRRTCAMLTGSNARSNADKDADKER